MERFHRTSSFEGWCFLSCLFFLNCKGKRVLTVLHFIEYFSTNFKVEEI